MLILVFLIPMAQKRQLSNKIFEITGLTISSFCQKFLHTNYKAFQYRIRMGRCNPNEIIFISWYLGESVEDLFGMPFTSLMIGQGDSEVSEKALQILSQASETEKERLMRLLGPGFSLGGSSPEDRAGVSPEDVEVLPPVLPGPLDGLRDVDVKARHAEVMSGNGTAQKKAPIFPTTVEDLAPKEKVDPFDIFDDFSLRR